MRRLRRVGIRLLDRLSRARLTRRLLPLLIPVALVVLVMVFTLADALFGVQPREFSEAKDGPRR